VTTPYAPPVNVLSLFSGIGGLELGLERAGMTVVGQVEIDPFCRRVLAKHWPDVPRHDDVRTCVEWWRSGPRPAVHVVAGGPPCQPVTTAGTGLAQDDPRWLWDETLSVVDALRPGWVIFENVPGLLRKGLAAVLGRLEQFGYLVQVGTISACALGAPHPRERVFIVAHADGQCNAGPERGSVASGVRAAQVRSEAWICDWWAAEPAMDRVADGVPGRVDRVRALGNAVVPQVAEYIGRLVMAVVA